MRIHRTIMSLGLSVLMAVSQIPFELSLSVTAASENAQTKRVMVSLGDSYSSGEGIEPFYSQDGIVDKILEEGKSGQGSFSKDVQDWLAHRSEACWSGRLKLPGVSGTMSDHPNENWFFVASSGAVIANLDNKQKKTYDLCKRYLSEHKVALDALDILSREFSESEIDKIMEGAINKGEDAQGRFAKLLTSDQYEELYKFYENLPYLTATDQEVIDPQLSVFDDLDSVDYVTMTMSGNDVGFTQIVEKAVPESFFQRVEKLQEVSQRNTHRNNNLQYQIDPLGSTPNSAIAPNDLTNLLNSKLQLFDTEVGPRLKDAYIAVQERAGSNAKIIVAGYPKLLNEKGSALFSAEASKQIDNCACIFNTKIKNIVEDSRINGGLNIYFVPVVDSFSGREAGTSDPYINYVEFTQSNDIDQGAFVSAYSIHPNEKGAAAYADAVQDKIDELEDNGIISGIIYEERPDTPVSDITSRIEKITAVNYDTDYKKSVYVDPAENTTFGKWRVSGDVGLIRNDSTGDDEGFSKLETKNLLYYSEDQISSTGHYEMVLPPGNYQLEVTCCDGTQFTLMDPNDPEQAEVVEVKARDVIKTKNIYLTEQEFGEPGSSYSWALEPSVEADDIYVVDTDEAYLDQDRIDKACAGFGMESKYSAYDSAAYRIGGTVGLIDYSGNILVTNEKHNVFTVQNGTIDVDYFWQFGWPGDPSCFYDYDESTGEITDEWNVPYNGTDTILVGKHDDQWNWKYGLYKKDTFLTSIDFENGKMNFASNNGVFALYKNDKWGYFDKDGNQIIDFVCDSVGCVPDGMLGLCVTGYGTDETGTDISESDSIHEHNDIYMATDGYIPVRIDGQWALYDVSGTQVIPTDVFAEIRPVHNGLAWVKDKETGLWGVIQLEESGDTTTDPDKQEDGSEENSAYLEDMPIIESDQYADNEGDSFVYKIGEHKHTRGNTDIDGVSHTHGLEVWIARWNYTDESSWAYSVFDLGGKYSSLSGKGVLIKSYNTTNFDTTLEFIGDGKLIKSYHLTPASIPFDIDINISGVKQLKVYAYDNKAASGGTSFGLTEMALTSDPRSSEYSEDELKSAVENASDGRIGAWAYADYDRDGNKEAFAVMIEDDSDNIKSVYYVNHTAEITQMNSDVKEFLYDETTSDHPRYLENREQGFFTVDMGAYGSGWRSLLYSVKNSEPYELQLSQNIQGFYKDDKGFYTTESDFSNGYHEYPEVNLIYDPTVKEFTKGTRRTDEDIQ